jgi:hypothetical protein
MKVKGRWTLDDLEDPANAQELSALLGRDVQPKIKKEMKREILLTGTDVVLPLSKFATPKTANEFIHLDKMADGTWRLLFNVKGVDIQQVTALTIVRDDNA